MHSEIDRSDIYQLRVEKLERAKIRIDEIKAKVSGLEKELLEIKHLDKQFLLKKSIYENKKDTIYKVDNILFFGDLMYQRFPNQNVYRWDEAVEYSKNIKISGYDGWRLPTVEELEKLLTRNCIKNSKGDSHYIIRDFLENIPTESCFWSSTQENNLYAWVIDFSKGYDYWRSKKLNYHVLFVRDV